MKNKSFTLVETTITLGVFSIIAMGVISTFNGSRDDLVLENAQATVVQAFEQVRNRAATGVGEEKHSVYIDERTIVIFEGETYTPGIGEETILPSLVSTDQNDLTVSFNRLSVQPNSTPTVTITYIDGTEKTVTIRKS